VPALTTYRNAIPLGFCPGCGHRLILESLDRALVRLQWDPAKVVIVSDIGCVGLSDQYLITSGFHGLHGRSLTYATGIKLARPDLHVITLIGDGGCGIGAAHLVSAARRNIGVTTLVFNNLNFGMTGGEHSVTTPTDGRTTTTPWGNTEVPLDIAQTVAANGAMHVWRGTVFEPDLDDRIEAALRHNGFALLDIWDLCVAYYAATNKATPQALLATMEQFGLARGTLRYPSADSRPEGSAALAAVWAPLRGKPASPPKPLDMRFSSALTRPFGVTLAGAAGTHVRAAGHLVGAAATLSGLWTAQRDDYPTTVRAGHSTSEVLISPDPIHHMGITRPDVLFVLAPEGYKKAAASIGRMTPESWIFVVPELADQVTAQLANHPSPPHIRILALDALKGIARSSRMLAAVAAGVASLGILDPEALIAGAGELGAAYAQVNQDAVRTALSAADDIVRLPDA
jgi:pyruvate/2-oxoacid:ferredoxin oxidoreductase beta subunit/Pyruvate/2-oxoacid:ferredoxin oxidoreductase gamma subunit